MADAVGMAEWERVHADLWARTAAVAGRLNRAHAELVEIAVELIEGDHWGDGGFRSAEHYLVVRAALSPARARDVVVMARRMAELPVVAVQVAAGALSLDQAAVVARHVPAGYQQSVGELAAHLTVPQLRRAVSRHAFADPVMAAAEMAPAGPDGTEVTPAEQARSESERRACARPELSMTYDGDGRFQLRYSAPATVGALVERALREAKDALFLAHAAATTVADGGPNDSGDGGGGQLVAGPRPSYADALGEIASRSLAGVASTSRAGQYRVYVHLSTDGAWVNARGAIPVQLVDRLLVDGTVQPVWETDSRPVAVGRAMRILPARARRLIEDRDRGCRFPGCTTTAFTEVHHLVRWADGGSTDLDNQVSLCPFHHDAIDHGDYQISGDPDQPEGLKVTNRYGYRVGPPNPADTAAPPGGDLPRGPGHPAYQPPTGEPIRWRDLDLPPDVELDIASASQPATA